MKKNKLLLLLLLAVFTVSGAAAASCGKAGKTSESSGGGDSSSYSPEKSEGEETGVYYCDPGDGGEYQIVLYGGDSFTATIDNANQYGTYRINGGNLAFSVSGNSQNSLSATYSNDVLIVVYNDRTMVFLRKETYVVTYAANGGSAVDSVSVVNGKTLSRPENPVRSGYTFVGWYTDENYTVPFLFGTQAVTSDMTLYAQWAEKIPGQSEFLVKVSENYEGGATEVLETINGRLYDLPVPVREGYTFAGWWVSMYNDGAKLSYRYTDGMTFNENTSLYAAWQSASAGSKLASPLPEIGNGSISWGTVPNATAYRIVIAREGVVLEDTTLGANRCSFNFADKEAGHYTVSLTALAATSANNSDESVVYYKNKALPGVSRFTVVDGGTLLFDGVEGAEKYYIAVDCGNDAHNHEYFDNGGSTSFNFSNCAMQPGGIRFVVTAVANGYLSSVSEEYVYNRTLSPIGNLTFDEGRQLLAWDPVENAAGYVVSVGNGETEYVTENIGNRTSYSLKQYTGDIVVNVYPATKGYNSPEASTLTLRKTMLATPSGIGVEGSLLSWNAVVGAEGYEVKINEKTFAVTDPELDISSVTDTQGAFYSVSVRAIGAENSAWSDETDIRYLAMADRLSYRNGVVSWDFVAGAVSYEVKVNDGEANVVSGVNRLKITLTQSGENIISVRFFDGVDYSDWANVSVYAHAVYFNAMGGKTPEPVYRAAGDSFELPDSVKEGYDFVGWYNGPGGSGNNFSAYEQDSAFNFNGDIVVYAGWRGVACTITYELSGGISDEQSKEVIFGEPFRLAVPTNTDTRLVFGGWFSDPTGGTKYTDSEGNSLIAWDRAADVTLYARWYAAFKFTLLSDNTYSVTRGADISRLNDIVIPSSYDGRPVTVVDGYAFRYCYNLRSVSIPNTVTLVESTAFYFCSGLESVSVYEVEGIKEIMYKSHEGVLLYNDPMEGAWSVAYYPPKKAGEYAIPEGVGIIPLKAFASALVTKVTIPSTVTRIGANAFYNCQKLAAVVFSGNAPGTEALGLSIAESAFSNCRILSEITLPARMTSVDISVFEACISLETINVEEGGTVYSSVDGFLCTVDKETIVYCPKGRSGELTIPAGITKIGDYAFSGCAKLTELFVPFYVSEIGEGAFLGCTKLTGVSFEGGSLGTQKIGDYAFSGCYLETLVFEADCNITEIGTEAFAYNSYDALTLPASLTKVASYAFKNNSKLKSLTFAGGGNAELTIESDAFNNCLILTTVNLSENLVALMPNVFSGCRSIAEINVAAANKTYEAEENVLYYKGKTGIVCYPVSRTGAYILPATIETIGDYTFSECSGLTSVVIPKSVTTIGAYAFYNCVNLVEVVFEEGGTQSLAIGDHTFVGDKKLRSVSLPERLTAIPDYMFYGLADLNEVTCPNVTEIGAYAFHGTNISSLDIAKVESIGDYAFYNSKFAGVIASEKLTTIGDRAFYGSKITAVTLSPNMTSVGKFAFASCTALTELTIQSGVKTISESAFSACSNLASIYIPASVTEIGGSAFISCSKATFSFEEGGTEPLSIGSNAFNRVGSSLATGCELKIPARTTSIATTAFGNTKITGSVTIPASVTTLGTLIFSNCSLLTEIVFEDGDTPLEISTSFASGAKLLESVRLSSRITAIPKQAFYGCVALTSIYIPENVSSIAADAFQGCSALSNFSVSAANHYYSASQGVLYQLTEKTDDSGTVSYEKTLLLLAIGAPESAVVVPNTVVAIADNAFSSNKVLASVTFETGRTEKLAIGSQAFYQCTALTEIRLPVLASLGASAFRGCTNLSILTFEEGGEEDSLEPGDYAFASAAIPSVNIPAYMTIVGTRMFDSCKSLTEVTFTDGGRLTKISNYAFNLTKITSIVIPDSVTTINTYAFSNCSALTEVRLPRSLSISYASSNPFRDIFSACGALESISISEDAEVFAVKDNVIYSKDLTRLIWCSPAISGALVIPEGVTVIGTNAMYSNTRVTSVSIPASVTEIRASAFSYMSGLTAVTFADGGTEGLTIGSRAFYESAIEKIDFPARLESLENLTLGNCESLTSVTFADGGSLSTLPTNLFNYCTALTSVRLPDSLTTISQNAFYYCTALAELVIPSRVEKIEQWAFNDTGAIRIVFEADSACITLDSAFRDSGLTEIVFPDHLTAIGSLAFNNCKNLKSVTIPEGVTTIGTGAFQNCTSLSTVVLPSTLTSIGGSAFSGDKLLTELEFPASLTSLGSSAFTNTGFVSIVIPKHVTTLGSGLFSYCASLESVEILYDGDIPIGDSFFLGCSKLSSFLYAGRLTAVGRQAFYECSLLESITLDDSVETINEYAFRNCKNLTSINIPASLVTVGREAFMNCAGLTGTIVFPETLKTIGLYAFQGCTGIEGFEFYEGLGYIGMYAFSGCTSLTSFYVPSTVTSLGTNPFLGCTSLAKIEVDPGNLYYLTIDNVVYDSTLTSLIAYPTMASGPVVIPESIKTIAVSAFENSGVTSVAFEGALSSIGSRTFANCLSLTHVEMPVGLVSIGASAFLNCPIENAIVIPRTVTSIGANAFQNTSIPALTFEAGGTSALKIGDYAFQNTSITALELPVRLRTIAPDCEYALNVGRTIGNYAFEGCAQLQSVTYESDVALSVSAILTFGKYAFANCISLKSFYFPKEVRNLYILNWEYWYDELGAIGAYAFYGCTQLESVEFEDGESGRVAIGGHVFEGCTSLSSVKLSNLVEFIDRQGDAYVNDPASESVFAGCTSLVSVALPERTNFSSIPAGMFENCTKLVSVSGRIISVGERAFNGCTALTTINSTENITTIGKYAFANCTSLNFSTASTYMTISANAFSGWTASQTITFSKIAGETERFAEGWNADCNATVVWMSEEDDQ